MTECRNLFRANVTFKSKNSPKYDSIDVQNSTRHVLTYSVKLIA